MSASTPDGRRAIKALKAKLEQQIRQAYRQRARDWHPDGGGSAEQFQQLQEALQLLLGGIA